MEYILAFESTHHAIQAERILLQAGLPVTVMPLPAKIRAGCGICLRLKAAALSQGMVLVRGCKIPFSVYEKLNQEEGWIFREFHTEASGERE